MTELPDLTQNSVEAVDDDEAGDGDYRRYLAVWQATAVREFGWVGVALAVLGTAVLATALVRAGRLLGRAVS